MQILNIIAIVAAVGIQAARAQSGESITVDVIDVTGPVGLSSGRGQYSSPIFAIPFKMGTTPFEVSLVPNTAQTGTWALRNRTARVVPESYSSFASPTFTEGKKGDFKFGEVQVTGAEGLDRVEVGGAGVEGKFVLADVVTGLERGVVNDKYAHGMVGLALEDEDNIVRAMFKAGLIKKETFNWFISKSNTDGKASFGAYDTNSKWFTTTTAHWSLPLSSVMLNESPVFEPTTPLSAPILTSENDLLLPAAAVKQVMEKLGAKLYEDSGYFRAPCDAGAGIEIGFVVEGVVIRISGADLLRLPRGEGCVVEVRESSDGGVHLGNAFLKRFTTSFDYSAKTIGFAVSPDREPLASGKPSIEKFTSSLSTTKLPATDIVYQSGVSRGSTFDIAAGIVAAIAAFVMA
ncbi:hypothetical protein HDU67_003736 [Dinochytrium kinnereticum]|nr:hypothetical protein HDU67_003736 [Dinochytrium kinnereticum]